MNEYGLRCLYRFLDHSSYFTRCGSLDYQTGKYEEKYVKGEDEVIKYARLYDGKRNIFVSRARRNEDGSINGCSCISFDIDPVRPKGEASTNEQHNNAINAGRRIVSVYSGGYLCSSGNGCLLLYRVPSDFISQPDYYRREGALIKELQQLVSDLGVKIDATNYAPAVIKAIGTMSTKGAVSLRRLSKWIDYPIQPYKRCDSLLKRLTEITPLESNNGTVDIRKLDSSFKGDRSTADFYLVTFLKQSGVSAASALQALRANPIGRQTDEKDQARLISKIYGEAANVVGEGKSEGYFDELARISDETEEGRIFTGLAGLDNSIRQLPKGEITVVAARSGFGKSSFACTLSEYLRTKGRRVLYFSTELPSQFIMHKLVSVNTGIHTKNLKEKQLTEEDQTKIQSYRKEFETSPLSICDEDRPTLQLIQNKVIEYKPDIVIVDHVTHIFTNWEKLAGFLKDLHEKVAKVEQIPILCPVQLNEPPRGKDGSEGKSLRGDVRGTQELINISGLFLLFSNPYITKGDYQPVDVEICKDRINGSSGEVVYLTVNRRTGKFRNREASDAANLQEL